MNYNLLQLPVDSFERLGPGLPRVDDASDVNTERTAATTEACTASVMLIVKTSAASVPTRATRVCANVLTARSADAFQNDDDHMSVTSFVRECDALRFGEQPGGTESFFQEEVSGDFRESEAKSHLFCGFF